jgi:hypothetical protein
MKYRFVSENPLAKMEDIIINNALPLVIKGKSKNEIEINIISLITKGLLKLRNSGQENKKIYELFVGCIYATFLNNRKGNIKYKFIVLEPEDDSYDFLISRALKNPPKEEKIIDNTKHGYYDSKSEHKVELTEAFKGESLKSIILKKFDPKKDYKGRVLLVVVHEGILHLGELANWILNYKQDNFKFVYLAFLEAKKKETWIYAYDIENKKCSADSIKFTVMFKNIIERLYKE